MSRFKLKGIIRDGFLRVANEVYMRNKMTCLNDKEVEIVVSLYRNKRSVNQNNWYWGPCMSAIIEQIHEMTGEHYTKAEIHDWHLSQVVKPKVETKEMFGTTIVTYKSKSTAEMDTLEFSNYKETIQRYWSEKNVVIPDPKQKIFIND
jgi:coenzyme F420-reducing hydrogenase alpha subunit